MKKTFATTLPDRSGAFLAASNVLSLLGVNITRVSYNKAVDTHTLFLDVQGDEAALATASARLKDLGYLQKERNASVILLEFELPDVPGSVLPVLKLINQFHFNISYISSQENGTPHQHFLMGLLVENSDELSAFLQRASQLCPVKVIEYSGTEKVLDNTVFYITFASRIAQLLGLSPEQKADLVVQSNRVMQLLDARNSPPHLTFDYIGRFAQRLFDCRGDNFSARVTSHPAGDVNITLIEPPCGSNLCVLDTGGQLLCVDSGFACFRGETLRLLRQHIEGFDSRAKDAVITHSDVDHCGMLDVFDNVYVSGKSYAHFENERAGSDSFREQNQLHAPYVRISKILTGYAPPDLANLRVIEAQDAPPDALLHRTATLEWGGLCFEVHEGAGGHTQGEIILIERAHRLLFTGDIYVNIGGFTPEQAEFNRIAPYLMTSVDTDPQLAAQERAQLFALLGSGSWQLFGGHGGAKTIEV